VQRHRGSVGVLGELLGPRKPIEEASMSGNRIVKTYPGTANTTKISS
jgi:hypothetical protein